MKIVIKATKMKTFRLLTPLALTLGLSAVLILALGSLPARKMPEAQASQAEMSNTITVCDTGCNYDTIQAAVDGAQEGDTIKVATGIYSGVSRRPIPPGYMLPPTSGVITQVVYISKTVTIQGGYTTANWDTPDPDAYPTTVDAQRLGRVLFITGDISPTISGLRITGGDDRGLGGWDWRWVELDAGGGVYILEANVLFEDNVVVDNISGDGAGVVLNNTPSTVRNNQILSNTAPYGGGMGVYSNAPLIENNVIRFNVATDNGAGVYLIETEATIRGNIISNNTADRFGAGLRLRGGDPTFINNVVADNQARYGSALYVDSSSARFWHTTFARNGGSSAVYIPEWGSSPATVALTNTIFSGHATAVAVGGGNTVLINGVLWYDNTTNVMHAPTATVLVTNQRTGDPVFAPDGYHLLAGSAAIDAGVTTPVSLDIDGDPRPCGGYDLGADETGLMITKQATPDPVQPGASLTYTISITNISHVTLTATVTDVLPAQVTPSGSLTWTASITAPGGVWSEQFTVTVNAGYAGVLTNVVQVTTKEGAAGVYTHTVSTLPLVNFDSPSYDIDEGGGSATIAVILSQASTLTATVEYATGNGTATTGQDYTFTSGTLVFTPGVTSQIFIVPIAQDSSDEYDETVSLTLSNADNATIGSNNPTTLTIEDDDGPPNLSIDDTSIAEGDSGSVSTVFTVILSTASGKPITVEYATADGSATAPADYTAVSTTVLTFDPGVTTQLVTVTVKSDTLDETNETFWVNLTNATNAGISDGQGQGTITDDDDSPTLSISDATVIEGDGDSVSAVFSVTLSSASGKMVTVEYATADGSATAPDDYTAIPAAMLTLNPGEIMQQVAVAVKGDTLYEGGEVFWVNLASPTNATIADGQGQGTIEDDDEPPTVSFGSTTYSVTEDAGTIDIVVTLDALSALTATVEYTATGGTATPGEDYAIISGTLTFTPGVTSQSFTVSIVDDTVNEGAETIILTLFNPDNVTTGSGTAVLTIMEDFKVYLPLVMRNYP